MLDKELDDIRQYWTNKYPTVAISIYPRVNEGKYCGKMITHNSSCDLSADTIGELISQGESFLRTIK